MSAGMLATSMITQRRTVRALLPTAYRIVRHRFSVPQGGSALPRTAREILGRCGCLPNSPCDQRDWWRFADMHLTVPATNSQVKGSITTYRAVFVCSSEQSRVSCPSMEHLRPLHVEYFLGSGGMHRS